MSNVRLFSRVFAGFAALALMVGCGSSAPPPVSVAVAPTTATLVAGATQTFTATVTNDSTATPGVTWTASAGTITAGGVYTAPTPVPATAATITATSKTDTTKTATASVTFTPIAVSITTTPVAMVAGATQTFAATVTGDATLNQGVTWSASVGTITAGGVYTAPTPVSTATATITATSKTDTTKTNTATVTLTPIAVTITTTPVAMVAGATQTFAATVTGDATLNAGVTWSASVGTITAGGVYTAPTPVSTATATITATSKTDTTKTNTATVTLTPIAVTITTTPVAMVAGATQTFAATVTGDATLNAGVTWSASVGTITAGGVYTAPTPVSTATATITATSKTDTTKTNTATVTLTPIAVSIPTTPTAIAGAATEAITATVTGDATLNQGVTWSITSGGGALSAVTTTSVTYTAPLPVTTANAVITATSKTDTTKTATITIPLTPISVGAISPATVNLGTTSTQAFTGAAVSNDSSNSGVTWTISPATGAGTIVAATGAYTAPASVISSVTTVTVTATSVKDPTKSATATITLNPIAIGAISPLTASLNGGGTQNFTGAALTYDGSNSGVTWTISPASGAGTIVAATGAYTAPAVVSGSSPVTVTVTATSVKDNTKSTTATITLNPIVVSFGSTTSATLDAGQQYAGVAATITNDASNSGIAFTVASGGGDIGSSSTTSTTIASSPFTPVYYSPASVASQTTTTITASSVKDPTKTAVFTVTLNPAMSWTTPSSNTATLTGAQTNTAYSYTLVTAGGTGSKTYTVTSGTLPAGLSLNSSTGAITGSPTGGAGSSTFVVRTTDQSSNPSILNGTFTIVVTAAPLAWSSPTSGPAAFTVGTAITPITLVATGGAGSLTYSLNSGTLPAGLSIVGNQLTGTPTQPTLVAGTAVTFKATDSTTPIPQTINSPSITIVVNPVTLAITSTTLPIGTVGTPYSYQLTSTGGTGTVNWSLSAGSLSGTGLTLSSSGLLSGTPLIVETGLSLTFQAQDSATNQQQTKTAVLPLNIVNPLTITTTQSTLPPAYSGLAYPSTTLAASGGSGTGYTWSVTSGLTGSNSLQTLNLAVSAAGVITGTPATTGTANFTVQVTDSASRTTTATYTITAYTPLSLPAANPTLCRLPPPPQATPGPSTPSAV